jgi:oligo-1,6-glucosidase
MSWWKEAIVYQVYPRSFKDSNGDGIGDLQGIISKLDYLKLLGIDVIWISPCFKSPNIDNGYDISDYEAIMADFGTMADFDELLAETHKRGLKLIIDLVVNHSSDQHRWFQEARKSKENPYRDYYIWRKEKNDWISFFSGTAWELDELTNEYYLHFFVKQQPDLNWENPNLRQEIYKMMRFWLEKGVDGFRMDVISLISKDQTFPNFPSDRVGDLSYYANGPAVHDFLQEMNHEVLSKYDCMTVGEAFGVSASQAVDYTGQNRKELNTIYHFDHAVPRDEICFVNPKNEFKLSELKKIFQKWDNALKNDGWNSIYFGNHDNPRVISRFGDVEKFYLESAKMLATILLTLRGTPYIYQGDEIGMTNCEFDNITEFNDVQVLNAYQSLIVNGEHSNEQFMKASNQIARDHARTPMQWNDAQNAGFGDGQKTWLKVNPNYIKINAERQLDDPNSIFSFYKNLIAIRKANATLIYGQYIDLRPRCNRIWAFVRQDESCKCLIMCNFTNKTQGFVLNLKAATMKLLISNYVVEGDGFQMSFHFRPYEARIYELG